MGCASACPSSPPRSAGSASAPGPSTDPTVRYTVLVGEGSATIGSTVWAVVIALAIAAPVVVAVSATATYVLVRRSMKSVDDIRSRVADITTSDLAERVPVPDSRDEIAALAVTMNEMLARIEAGHNAQRRFVGDASHELRSPLTTIISALEVAVVHPEALGGELATTTLMPEAHRMKDLIDDLLLLARADERGLDMASEDVDLDDLAAAEVERLRRATDLEVRADLEPARSTGDPEALSRVLRNLLDNAARHAISRVSVSVRTLPEPRPARGVRRRTGYRRGGSAACLRPLRPGGSRPLEKRRGCRSRPVDRAGDRGGPCRPGDHRRRRRRPARR